MRLTVRFAVVAAFAACCFGSAAVAQEEGPRFEHVYEGKRLVYVDVQSKEAFAVVQQLGQLLACRAAAGVQPYLMDEKAVAELERLEIGHSVEHENVRELVEASARENGTIRARRGAIFFDAYRTLAEIESQFDGLVAAKPNVITKVNIGSSLQGRTIWAYRILAPDAVADPVRVVINGTQHAREWLSPMTNSYIATELVNGHGVDADITDMLREVEVVIIPVVNPDGYVYTHTTERFWRKNRRTNGDGTFGVDLNRNWGYQWAGGPAGSSSGAGSSDTYRGTAPFSEPETTVVSTFISSLADVRGHIDFHTFSSLILGPWGYNDTFDPPRVSELRTAQEEMSDAMLQVDGELYLAGLGSDQLLYTADGVMPDWTFGDQGALSWTIELRPSSGGLEGFDPPPSNILPAGQEGLAALLKLTEIAQREIEFTFPAGRPDLIDSVSGGTVDTTLVKWHGLDVVAGSVKIATRIGSAGAFTETVLSGSGDDYVGALPGAPCGSTVEYYFTADVVGGGSVSEPSGAPGEVFTAVVADINVAIADDMESGTNGWTVGDPSDTATTGIWERVDPVGTGAQPEDDHTPAGTQCWITGQQPVGGSIGTNDVDGGATTLISPLFDASSESGADSTLSFSIWYSNNLGTGQTDDSFDIDISNNDGATWISLDVINESPGVWQNKTYTVSHHIPPTDQMRVRFIAHDFVPNSIVEAGVDDFEVMVASCEATACDGDANGDSVVDVNDISFVLFRLGDTGSPGSVDGDANLDGTVDVNDISYVLFRLGPCV